MRCVHHFDADGRGAAAIVRFEFHSEFDMIPTPEMFVEYNHNGIIDIKDEDFFFQSNQTVYFVDLAADPTIMNTMKKAIEHGCKVVHIDHHISGKKFIDEVIVKKIESGIMITLYPSGIITTPVVC